ncbi:hypothetical protein VP382E491_P0005 [Vibrio phage 382E49-1]|nr:hypothetical protein VP382E491_P0005 [Vibrio phage 382E49-1]
MCRRLEWAVLAVGACVAFAVWFDVYLGVKGL